MDNDLSKAIAENTAAIAEINKSLKAIKVVIMFTKPIVVEYYKRKHEDVSEMFQ